MKRDDLTPSQTTRGSSRINEYSEPINDIDSNIASSCSSKRRSYANTIAHARNANPARVEVGVATATEATSRFRIRTRARAKATRTRLFDWLCTRKHFVRASFRARCVREAGGFSSHRVNEIKSRRGESRNSI